MNQHPESEQARPAPRSDVALFIDWENLKYGLRAKGRRPNLSALRETVAQYGRVVIARAYADWEEQGGDPSLLYAAGIEPIYVPTKRQSESRIPNSVDVKLTADCIKCAHDYPEIGTYVIVAGDYDYVHAANILRPYGKRVIAIGVAGSVSGRLVERIDEFLDYERDVDVVVPAPQTPVSAALKRELEQIFHSIVEILREARAAGRYPSVLSHIRQEVDKRHAGFNPSRFRFSKFKVLMQQGERQGYCRVLNQGMVDWAYLPEDEAMVREITEPRPLEPVAVSEPVPVPEAAPEPEEDRPPAAKSETGRQDRQRLLEQHEGLLVTVIQVAAGLEAAHPYMTIRFLMDHLFADLPEESGGLEAAGLNPSKLWDLLYEALDEGLFVRASHRRLNVTSGEVQELKTIRLSREHPRVAAALLAEPPPLEAVVVAPLAAEPVSPAEQPRAREPLEPTPETPPPPADLEAGQGTEESGPSASLSSQEDEGSWRLASQAAEDGGPSISAHSPGDGPVEGAASPYAAAGTGDVSSGAADGSAETAEPVGAPAGAANKDETSGP
ncbi:MAG: NYN domain-containing protein [Chloroflexi bacterium]|nr:NYN domain-containing protein [Chloroflexota bacterium]